MRMVLFRAYAFITKRCGTFVLLMILFDVRSLDTILTRHWFARIKSLYHDVTFDSNDPKLFACMSINTDLKNVHKNVFVTGAQAIYRKNDKINGIVLFLGIHFLIA